MTKKTLGTRLVKIAIRIYRLKMQLFRIKSTLDEHSGQTFARARVVAEVSVCEKTEENYTSRRLIKV